MAVLGVWLLSACGLGAAPVVNDDVLDEQLASIRESGEERRLHDLVSGEWTTVHVFDMEAAIRESVEEKVGFRIGMPDTYFSKRGPPDIR